MGWRSWLRGMFVKKQAPPVFGAEAHGDLRAHSEEFREEVIEVIDGVYVAVGFGLANSIMLVGEGGVVIVDTLGNVDAAKRAHAAFRKITTLPVKAIVYTHNHTDHIFGAGVFAGEDEPDIYAHETTSGYIDKIVSLIRPIIMRRSMRQFGAFLQEGDLINAGIGPFLETKPDSELALLRPTHTFGHRLEVELAGIRIEMEHTPGETNDHIFLWLPDKKLMIPGDNFYRSFPNLYAIRGTAHRDVLQWVRSVDRIREHDIEHLVPCHSRPLQGKETIHKALTDYRDGIQFVHDQTVRLMNAGLTPDQIVEQIKLPAHLAKSPYLQEFYGTVAWSVRSVFNGYLGWFGGNPTDLWPLSPTERAKRFVSLAGGEAALRAKCEEAASQNDHQWVLELTDQLLTLDDTDASARALRVEALKGMAAQQTSANGRNYYLTQAMELEGFALPLEGDKPLSIVHSIPLETIFTAMACALDPEASLDVNRCIAFRFTDVGEGYTLHIRHGVAETRPVLPAAPDVTITTSSLIWKELLAQVRNPVTTFASGDIKVEGSTLELAGLLRMFQPN